MPLPGFGCTNTSILLQKPQPTDGGVYKCNIKNEFGELNANLNLNIEGENQAVDPQMVFPQIEVLVRQLICSQG